MPWRSAAEALVKPGSFRHLLAAIRNCLLPIRCASIRECECRTRRRRAKTMQPSAYGNCRRQRRMNAALLVRTERLFGAFVSRKVNQKIFVRRKILVLILGTASSEIVNSFEVGLRAPYGRESKLSQLSADGSSRRRPLTLEPPSIRFPDCGKALQNVAIRLFLRGN
jgi:hypothetical protein